MRLARAWLVAVLFAFVAAGCSGARGDASTEAAGPPTLEAASAAAPEVTTSVTTAAPAPTPPPMTAPTATTAPPPPARSVITPAGPFATVGAITLLHPSGRVERVGFHQSNHEGAQEYSPLDTAVNAVTMEARERLTSGRTAADIVVDPAAPILSPVTGTVKRAGGYVLYCKYSDDYVVIAPDAQPAWEVKLLHISGVRVRSGDRVVAGETVLAPGPTPLPFESQVDEFTADPAWPHVHVEVVNPAIRNIPSPGGGC